MSVWYAFPAAAACIDAARDTAAAWRAQGYRVAVLTDGAEMPDIPAADFVLRAATYTGWASSVNLLCRFAIKLDADAAAVVCAGHDQSPDPDHTAQQIETQFRFHFPDGYGIMQPTGDKFAGNGMAAVSAWCGRGWIERAYGGNGPYWGEYFHFCPDSELWAVAREQCVYWERPDLSQYHAHWTREATPERPAHLAAAQAAKAKDAALFAERKAAGWPGSAPLLAQAWDTAETDITGEIETVKATSHRRTEWPGSAPLEVER